ncbi:apolipoprotein D-like [Uloborus diversus]|uniref:apolipoprotein D-like n=1 Tax=Uloborus diversus TaxID=327109 RepID=UPI002409AD6B|nr:apolipoprotein D-like [Uloborus diversus]
MRSFAATLFLALVAYCSGNSYKMGSCPRVVVMKSLDFDQFTGNWYVVQRFNPMATCTKISIEKDAEDQVMVNETSRPFGLNFGYHTQYLKPRKLNFLRNDTQSIFRLERNLVHFTLSTFGVVNTDYESFAVIWGCDPVLFGSIQNIDVWSREPKVNSEFLTKVRDIIKDMKVDFHPLDNVDQSRCESSSSETENADRNTNNIVADAP